MVLVGLISLLAAATIGTSFAASQPEVTATGVLINDDMARTVSAGWGSAEIGGSYTVSSPQSASVSAGVGTLTVPSPGATISALLAGTLTTDSVTTTSFALAEIPSSGGGVYTSLVLRRQTNRDSYRAKYRVLPGGAVRLSLSRVRNGVESFLGGEQDTGVTLAAGQHLNISAAVVGSDGVTLRSAAWLGATPPTQWQATQVDSAPTRIAAAGATGVMVYLSQATSAPAKILFSGIGARSADATTAVPVPAPTVPQSGTLTPSPPTAPTTQPVAGTGNSDAGSVAPGGASYPVPADAILVSPAGNDSASGGAAAPVRTVGRAIAIARSGQTIVVRAGTYHEAVVIPANKKLTVQAYPGEAVWFDGSSVVTGWTAAGSTWTHSGWTMQFDSTPCFTPGACATSDPDFQFVSAARPMAAHPDQVWINGTALQQVASAAQVTAGTFFVDYAKQELRVGSDPTAREVRASDLVEAITVNSAGSTLRGFGVRRYGTPLPRIATVKAAAPGVTLENLFVSDNATTGVSVIAAGGRLINVTSTRNGLLGIHANTANGLVVSHVSAIGNNVELFKQAPVGGGLKITKARGVQIRDSVFEDNAATGLWFDQSVYDIVVTGNTVARNSGHGVFVEISANAVVGDNLIANNGQVGLKINNSAGVQVWNNTFVGNTRMVWVVQDPRTPENSPTLRDNRQPHPDPTMTWQAGAVTLSDNVFSHAAAGSPCVVCVEDLTHKRSAELMNVVLNGNVYNRTTATSPQVLVVWSTGAGNPKTFATLPAFVAGTGQDASSTASDGPSVVSADGLLTGLPANAAQPLPQPVADDLGLPAGSRTVGVLS